MPEKTRSELIEETYKDALLKQEPTMTPASCWHDTFQTANTIIDSDTSFPVLDVIPIGRNWFPDFYASNTVAGRNNRITDVPTIFSIADIPLLDRNFQVGLGTGPALNTSNYRTSRQIKLRSFEYSITMQQAYGTTVPTDAQGSLLTLQLWKMKEPNVYNTTYRIGEVLMGASTSSNAQLFSNYSGAERVNEWIPPRGVLPLALPALHNDGQYELIYEKHVAPQRRTAIASQQLLHYKDKIKLDSIVTYLTLPTETWATVADPSGVWLKTNCKTDAVGWTGLPGTAVTITSPVAPFTASMLRTGLSVWIEGATVPWGVNSNPTWVGYIAQVNNATGTTNFYYGTPLSPLLDICITPMGSAQEAIDTGNIMMVLGTGVNNHGLVPASATATGLSNTPANYQLSTRILFDNLAN